MRKRNKERKKIVMSSKNRLNHEAFRTSDINQARSIHACWRTRQLRKRRCYSTRRSQSAHDHEKLVRASISQAEPRMGVRASRLK